MIARTYASQRTCKNHAFHAGRYGGHPDPPGGVFSPSRDVCAMPFRGLDAESAAHETFDNVTVRLSLSKHFRLLTPCQIFMATVTTREPALWLYSGHLCSCAGNDKGGNHARLCHRHSLQRAPHSAPSRGHEATDRVHSEAPTSTERSKDRPETPGCQ